MIYDEWEETGDDVLALLAQPGATLTVTGPVIPQAAPIAPSVGDLVNEGVEIYNRLRDLIRGGGAAARDPSGTARQTAEQLRTASAFNQLLPFLAIAAVIIVIALVVRK